MSQFDSLEKLFREYNSIACFRAIYISEAHPVDGDYGSSTVAKEHNIFRHVEHSDRCSVALKMCDAKNVNIPMLVDGMDNAVANAYEAFPTRFCVVGLDGKIVVTNRQGPTDLEATIGKAAAWLVKYRESLEQNSRN